MPGIGSALGIIREIKKRNKLQTLYIPETRPYNQGSRLTAFEAIVDKLPGVLITDSMIGMLMQKKMVDCVIVGADRVTKLGYTANKIGTYSIAILAKKHEIPFYVACPVSTIDYNMLYGREIEIEERHGDEMRKIGDTFIAPKQIKVWNPAFDITPPYLIENIITEKGSYEFDKNSGSWEEFHPDNSQKLMKFLLDNKLIKEEVTISYIGDGNLNHVYCVRGKTKAICVKQALPWCKCIGSHFPLSLKRAFFESEALKFHNSICPDLVPKFIYYNEDLFLFVMDFLEEHEVLRNGLMKGIIYKGIGNKIGQFVGKSCFYSSAQHLNPQEMRHRMSFWNENTLCVLTEQVVFSDPYVFSSLNRWTTPQLDDKVNEIKNDVMLILKVYELRQKFITKKQALIHGDLHSGSIMVDIKGSCKIIDPEFSFYGPIGYDTGNIIAHFIINYFTHCALNGNNEEYNEWILQEIMLFWKSFEDEYLHLWNTKDLRIDDFPGLFEKNTEILFKIQKKFIQEVLVDTLGFAGTEIIRRILGIAHVADFEKIKSKEVKANCEDLALNLSRLIIIEASSINSIEDLVEILRKSKN